MLKFKVASISLMVFGGVSFLLNVLSSVIGGGLNAYLWPIRSPGPIIGGISYLVASILLYVISILFVVLGIVLLRNIKFFKSGLFVLLILHIFVSILYLIFRLMFTTLYEVTYSQSAIWWFKYELIGLPYWGGNIFNILWSLASGIFTKIFLITWIILLLNSEVKQSDIKLTKQKRSPTYLTKMENSNQLKDLELLASLREKGIITNQEFSEKKKRILDL